MVERAGTNAHHHFVRARSWFLRVDPLQSVQTAEGPQPIALHACLPCLMRVQITSIRLSAGTVLDDRFARHEPAGVCGFLLRPKRPRPRESNSPDIRRKAFDYTTVTGPAKLHTT